jgi:hypothetical protein
MTFKRDAARGKSIAVFPYSVALLANSIVL